jgi:HAD superfamily hydrolase (TIGR01509 family)
MNITPQKKFRPQAVLFDYDGVLVSSEPIHLSAWLQLLTQMGLPADSEMIQKNVGRTAPEIMAQVLDRYRPGWSPETYDVHDLAKQKNVIYLSLAQKGLQPYPGVIEGLRWLRSVSIKTAVVSNAKRNELEKTMRHLGLFELFDQVISRDDAGCAKPDPTPYLLGAASLKLDPDQCIAIEDSPPGLEAALQAKVPAVAVLTNFSRDVVQSPVPGRPDLKPQWIFDSIQDFFTWLRSEIQI